MKTYLLAITTLLSLCFFSTNAQQRTANSVRYMVTFDQPKAIYTAWLVPDYSTPNFNNSDSLEKGATAQFSLKVPKGFVLSELKNITGDWEKAASKIGDHKYFTDAGVDPNFEYYIIGKAPSETNYGKFNEGEPVALFSFKGKTPEPGKVNVLENSDEFVDISFNKLALNVASSFYSRSGQASEMNARPLEQFKERALLKDVLQEMADRLEVTDDLLFEEAGALKSVLVYPNPANSTINVKYFSLEDEVAVKIELLDQNESVLQTKDETAQRGFNSAKFDLTKLNGSTYLLRTTAGENTITKKVLKIN